MYINLGLKTGHLDMHWDEVLPILKCRKDRLP
jgi:hypothetical protein